MSNIEHDNDASLTIPHCGDRRAAKVAADNPGGPHESRDPPSATVDPTVPQFRMDLWGTVGRTTLSMNCGDLLGQPSVHMGTN